MQFTLEGVGLPGENWSRVCILMNSHNTEPVEFTLPPGAWKVVCDPDGNASAELCEGRVSVRCKGGAILAQEPLVSTL